MTVKTKQHSSHPRWMCNLVALLLLFIPLQAAIADDDDNDRVLNSTNRDRRPIEELFKTDTVFPQEQGELELELGGEYQNQGRTHIFSIPLSVEYGLTDDWQVEAEWASFIQRYTGGHTAGSGVGDVEVGTQYSFLNIGGSDFHVAPRFSVEIPAGSVDKGLSEGFLEFEPAVILAHDFPQLHRTELFCEVGAGIVHRVNRPSDPDEAEPSATELLLGAGFFTMFKHGAATFEFNVANNQWNQSGEENQIYITPGYLWRPKRNVEVGLGIPVGLNNRSDRFQVLWHVVVEF